MIPTKFRKSGEAIIASYEYIDVAEGTGIIHFYGSEMKDSTGTEHLLTASVVYSTAVEYVQAQGTNSTIDFDLAPFNLPRTLKGTAYINMDLSNATAGNSTAQATIKHYDGTTATAVSSAVTSHNVATGAHDLILLEIPVTTTHFKKGDILRLSIKVTAGAGSTEARIGIDPSNRDGTNIKPSDGFHTSQLHFYCPFDLDL